MLIDMNANTALAIAKGQKIDHKAGLNLLVARSNCHELMEFCRRLSEKTG